MTSPSAGTNGFLFCDLRGYARYVDAHGDRAAAELLSTYRGLVRGVIAEHAGAEIRTEGDSVYVVFPTASAAVEAGLGIVAASSAATTAQRPIRVGVGIHAGETVSSAEGPVGGAVNIAARVCAKAQAGEVLVTDTVRALTRTLLPYRFVGLGAQHLKGIAGGVPIYRVEAVPASRLAHLRRRLSARRRRVALVASLVVVALVAAGSAWALSRPPACLALPASTKDVVARIDPTRGCVIATYRVGRGPSLIVWAGGTVWVANVDDQTVTVLSADGRPRATVGVGKTISAMAADDSSMWVLDRGDPAGVGGGTLWSVALDSASVSLFDRLPSNGDIGPASTVERAQRVLSPDWFAGWYEARSYTGLAVAPGQVWVSNSSLGLVIDLPGGDRPFDPTSQTFAVDPAPDSVTSYAAGGGPWPYTSLLALVGRTMWVAHATSPDLAVLDLDDRAVSHITVAGATGGATGLVAVDGDVLVSYHGGSVARVGGAASGSNPVTAVHVASTLAGVAADATSVWVVSVDDRSAIQLDPTTLAVERRIEVGGSASGVAVAPDGSVWVTVK